MNEDSTSEVDRKRVREGGRFGFEEESSTERQAEWLGVVRKSEISVMNGGHRPPNLRAGDAREQLRTDGVSRTT